MNGTIQRWLKVATALFVVLLLLFVAEWQYTHRRRDPKLDAIRAKLDQTEPGWQLDNLVSRWNASIPPPEENVADIVRDGVRLVPYTFREWNIHGRVNISDQDEGHLLSPKVAKELADQIVTLDPTLERFEYSRRFTKSGSKLEFLDSSPLESTFPHIDQLSLASHYLDWAILSAANQNRGDDAIDLCRTQLHLRCAYGREPTLVAQQFARFTVYTAIQSTLKTLGLTEPSNGLAELQTEFTNVLQNSTFEAGLVGERAIYDRFFERLSEGRISSDQYYRSVGLYYYVGKTEAKLRFTLASRHTKPCHAMILEFLTTTNDAMNLRGLARIQALAAIPFPTIQNLSNSLAYDIVDQIVFQCQNSMRCESHIASIIAALACERFRQKTGNWPNSLDSIPKSILPFIPVDPYSGDSIRYERTETGIKISYVIQDDTRTGVRNAFAHPVDNGREIGIFLLDTKNRRQPPKVIDEEAR